MKTVRGNGVFFMPFNILVPALRIKNATAHLIPSNAYATNLLSITVSRNREIINIIINAGITTPTVAAALPRTPAIL